MNIACERVGWAPVVLAVPAGILSVSAQTLNNQALNGKYFFRHVSLGTDSSGNLTDPRSLIGAIAFDGAGGFRSQSSRAAT